MSEPTKLPPKEVIVGGTGNHSLWVKWIHFIRRLKSHKLIVATVLAAPIIPIALIAFVTTQHVLAPMGIVDAPPIVSTEEKQAAEEAKQKEQTAATSETPASQQQASAPAASAPPTSGGGSSGACATSTQHVPDGPDGMGGCWPGPSNTGVPSGVSLSNYSGPCTITTAGTVIDAKTVSCQLLIRANNVTIKRSHLLGGVNGIEGDGASFSIEDSNLDNGVCDNCSVDGWNFTIKRTEITGSNRGAYCMHVCTVQDSWIHGTALDPNSQWHASAMRAEQYATIIHNVLACDWTGPFNNDEIGCSADMSGYPDFAPIMHNTMDSNFYRSNNVGVGFCAYGGGTNGKPYSGDANNATYIVFKNNVFERGSNGKCGTYGPITDFIAGRTGNIWTNNRWTDGATVDPE